MDNKLKNKGTNFYNYILFDGDLLYKIIDDFDINSVKLQPIKNIDIHELKKSIIYVGKGKNNRKHTHLVEGKKIIQGVLPKSKMCAKYSKIKKVWEKGSGVVVMQIFSDSDHYLALCRENAMIKAVGNTLTNLINGSIYGLMESNWTTFEIKNFGEMLLYFALNQCILERPTPILMEDIKTYKTKPVFEPKKYFIKTNYELNGILDSFLDM